MAFHASPSRYKESPAACLSASERGSKSYGIVMRATAGQWRNARANSRPIGVNTTAERWHRLASLASQNAITAMMTPEANTTTIKIATSSVSRAI